MAKNNKKKRRDNYQAPKQNESASSARKEKEREREAAIPERPSRAVAQRANLSWWLLAGGVVAIVGLVIVLSVVLGENQTGVTDAEAWELPVLDNDPDGDGRISLAEFEGKPVVLNFFASWCVNCERELPVFRAAADEFADDVQVLFINANESDTGAARSMAERTGIDDQILIDDIGGSNNNGLHRSLGGTGSMPMTAFYDSDGNVANVVRGELNANQLYGEIMSLLDS